MIDAQGSGSRAVREPSPRRRWLLCGVVAGAAFGAWYGWLGAYLAGQSPDAVVLAAGSCAGLVMGAVFAARYYSPRRAETSLCTWLGLSLGLIPAAVVALAVLGSGSKLQLYALAAIAYAPILSGLFAGGLMDRLSEGFLFLEKSDDGPLT